MPSTTPLTVDNNPTVATDLTASDTYAIDIAGFDPMGSGQKRQNGDRDHVARPAR